ISENRFIERYYRKEAALHVHGVFIGSRGTSEFCISIEYAPLSIDASIVFPHQIDANIFSPDQMEMSVFVDIRQLLNPPQSQCGYSIGSVIRLNTLDECKGILRNRR